MTWAATVAGHRPQTTYHDKREMRAAGTKHGICWELDITEGGVA